MPTGWARVVLARTSVPPCFSVMAMPMVTPAFCSMPTLRGSYSLARIFGTQISATSGCRRRAGTPVGPGQRRQAVLDGRAHQLVIGRVEFHQVDAVAVAVMGLELRLVLVGQ